MCSEELQALQAVAQSLLEINTTTSFFMREKPEEKYLFFLIYVHPHSYT